MSTRVRWSTIALYVPLVVVALNAPWSELQAQSVARMFEAPRLGPRARPTERPVRPHQARKARLRLEALDSPSFVLNLFDNAEPVATRTKVERPSADRLIWHGKTDDGGIATFAVVNGVATGTVFLDGRSFEITTDADGDYTIAELNAAAFPVDVDPIEAPDEAADVVEAMDASTTSAATMEADGAIVIDVMVVWTPAARAAAGGTSAIQSVILSSVANANLAYANSQVNARLRLVHSAEVAFTETPSNISSDLASFRGTTDGKADNVHSLRTQYGADVVTLIGNGYAGAGSCGMAYMMGSPSTAYASAAFNIVDRTCAAGYLSYAHEVGHNQGLAHDPGNAGSTPSRPYAYGYQDPGNAFRTVLSYGGATRVPYFSNPGVTYGGRVTGTSTQNNARALNDNALIVSAFKTASGTTPCSYTVSPGSFSFSKAAQTASVEVTTTSTCSWSSSSGSAWATVSGSKTGSGTAVVSVTANSATSRTATVTVAGKSISVSQASGCTYTVSPTSLSFSKAAGTASVTVSTSSACSWSASSPTSWASVTGGRTGSGTAVVAVTANSANSRTAAVVVAGKSITVSQAAGCSYTVSPASLSFSKTSGTASVTVSTTSACAWSASSPVAWAKVTGSKTGSGTAVVSVTANSANKRTATLVVAGKSVTLSQASGCTFTVSPISMSFTKAASTKSVAVTTTSACTWTSSSASTWAKVTGGRTGSGTAVVSVTANKAMARKATVVVAGKTITVSQATGCVYTVSPTSLSFTKAGGTKTVSVVTTAVCKWSPSSPASWAVVSGARYGSGSATVKVAANSGGSRSLTLKVATKSVTVKQAGQ